MIFVNGCAHGGTTLMATVLNAHPDCYTIPVETWEYTNSEYVEKTYIAELELPDKIIVEKTPAHVFHINQISEEWPDAKFIVMVRHPFDLYYSKKKRWTKDPDLAMITTVRDLNAVLAAKHKDNVMIVQYENLAGDFENTVRKVCNHVGIEYDKEMENFHEHAPTWFGVNPNSEIISHEVFRNSQVHQPLFNGVGKWRGNLSPEEIRNLNRTCMTIYKRIIR